MPLPHLHHRDHDLGVLSRFALQRRLDYIRHGTLEGYHAARKDLASHHSGPSQRGTDRQGDDLVAEQQYAKWQELPGVRAVSHEAQSGQTG